jgi:hypothetical protein
MPFSLFFFDALTFVERRLLIHLYYRDKAKDGKGIKSYPAKVAFANVSTV